MSHSSLGPTLIIIFYMNTENVHYLGGAQVAYAMAAQVLNGFHLVRIITKTKNILS